MKEQQQTLMTKNLNQSMSVYVGGCLGCCSKAGNGCVTVLLHILFKVFSPTFSKLHTRRITSKAEGK